MRRLVSSIAIVLVTAGCPPVDNPYLPLPEPDYDGFVARVQPVVAVRCASNGCHGDYQRTLTLFAPGYLRAAPTQKGVPLNPGTLTELELAWNYDALRMRLIDETEAADAVLLRKCLDPEQGGIVHADDVVIYETVDDPEYVLLQEWIASGL